jgi:hypothetical protein
MHAQVLLSGDNWLLPAGHVAYAQALQWTLKNNFGSFRGTRSNYESDLGPGTAVIMVPGVYIQSLSALIPQIADPHPHVVQQAVGHGDGNGQFQHRVDDMGVDDPEEIDAAVAALHFAEKKRAHERSGPEDGTAF